MYDDLVKELRDSVVNSKQNKAINSVDLINTVADLIEIWDEEICSKLYRADYLTPTSEETPRLTGNYLVKVLGKTVYAFWDWDKHQWFGLGGYPLFGVTFWMELPNPPEEDE